MKISLKNATVLLMINSSLTPYFSEATNNGAPKYKSFNMFNDMLGGQSMPRLVSFNSEEGNVDIDLDISVPFISVPLTHKSGENGELSPLFNVNPKALTIVAVVTTVLAFITPLFSKTTPNLNYRNQRSAQWSLMERTINEMIFGNNYVAPCMQRIICYVVSSSTHAENPTSMEKIIDGLSSHNWFKEMTNGSLIQDAVAAGREGIRDCGRIYQDCLITPRLLKNMMSQLGIA